MDDVFSFKKRVFSTNKTCLPLKEEDEEEKTVAVHIQHVRLSKWLALPAKSALDVSTPEVL